MPNEAKFLSIAKATVENFNEVGRKKGHKKIIDIFQNSLLILLLFIASFVAMSCQSNEVKFEHDNDQVVKNSIRWNGTNEIANYMALQGLNRYIVYENSHAFVMSEGAVKLDSTLFASHVILAFLGYGTRKEYHKELARKFVQNENEVSKLFVALLDFDETNDSSREQRRTIWTKMHQLTVDPFIHYMYIRYMKEDDSAILSELEELIEFCKRNNNTYTATAANNMKGYILKRNGDLKLGTQAIDQCLELHPDGYNPIDSRAEFYLYASDTVKAVEFYKKVLEKYPYAQYASDQLEKLERQKTN